ncbi:MAG: hypothetical protein IPM74_14675 [Crocinitomicaceae bacterium]|nr:hypothetical protein [Crocinitomicaceae bacterium]MBK8927115.1 hypothetical protein [Crocinitomicaceae bacterium]
MKYWINFSFAVLLAFTGLSQTQNAIFPNKQIRFNFSEDGKEYARLTFLNQTWIRYTDANPGTTVNGYSQRHIFDIGLRRTRIVLSGKVSPRSFFYVQFGMNNFTYNTKHFSGFFIHDALCEFVLYQTKLSIGAGLCGWNGLSRFSSQAAGMILALDIPLYQLATIETDDYFARRLSLYAKGKLGKLDYRLVVSKPAAIVNATATVNPLSQVSDFSPLPAKLQTHGYFMYQFFDQEDNTVPYTAGTYHGNKKIFNLGAGFFYQPKAMWHLGAASDTLFSDLILLAADVFMEIPLHEEKKNTISFYGAFSRYDFGQNYVRNAGIMNPANGVLAANSSFNGAGNAYPTFGTGNTIYLLLGYMMKKNLIGSGTLQYFVASQISDFDRFSDLIVMYEFGVNWLITGGHQSKVSANLQMRPVINNYGIGFETYSHHRAMVQLQYQISL